MVTVNKKQRQDSQKKQGTGKGRPSKINEVQKDQMVVHYNTGKPVTDIAKMFGVNRATVYRVVKERTTDT